MSRRTLLFDLDDQLRRELVVCLAHGVTARESLGRPPSAALRDLAQQLLEGLETPEDPPGGQVDESAAETVQDDPRHDRQLLTRVQAAQVIGVSVKSIDRLRRAGRLPEVRLGRSVRIRRRDVQRILEV